MSTIKTGTTTTTGLIVEADTSGNLVVQTGSTPTTALTISGTNQQVTLAAPLVNPVPAFEAYASANQTLTNNTDTVAVLDAVEYDTNNWFNTSTYRYTPQIAGYYFFRSFMVLSLDGSVSTQQCKIAKNGTTIHRTVSRFTHTSTFYQECTGMLYLNGTTDYAEMRVQGFGTTTCALVQTGISETRSAFSGFLVRAA